MGRSSGRFGKLLYYPARTSLNEIMFLSGEILARLFPSNAQGKALAPFELTGGATLGNAIEPQDKAVRLSFFLRLLLGLTVLLTVSGCQTTEPTFPNAVAKPAAEEHSDAIILREGDVLKITFPGAPELS